MSRTWVNLKLFLHQNAFVAAAQNKINHKELAGLVSFLSKTGKGGGGIVLSKSTFDVKDDYVVIPASIFLLLI